MKGFQIIMRINSAPIYQQPSQKKPISFKSIYYQGAVYRDVYGIKRETQNSTCKRKDLDYGKLAKISKERFAGFDRVNIMPMNVSDGTESYFTSQAFIKENGLDVFEKKYSPLKSSDVCQDIINRYPKNFIVHLFKGEPEELKIVNEPMFKPMSLFEYPQHILNGGNIEPLFKLDPKYQKFFNFFVMDFQERLAGLNDEGNSIVMIRNCLKQSFGDIKSATIAYQLADKLKGASLFITGDYDRGMRLFESALDDNFVEIEHNIWAKKDYEEQLHKSTLMPDAKENLSVNKKGLKKLFNSLKKHIKR